jgi:hypothetical protein
VILKACVDCGAHARTLTRGRCNVCRRKQDRASYYQSPQWRTIRALLIHDACDLCGSTYRLTLHHTQGRRRGGSDRPENLRWTLCGTCHSRYEADVRTDRDTELRRRIEAVRAH